MLLPFTTCFCCGSRLESSDICDRCEDISSDEDFVAVDELTDREQSVILQDEIVCAYGREYILRR